VTCQLRDRPPPLIGGYTVPHKASQLLSRIRISYHTSIATVREHQISEKVETPRQLLDRQFSLPTQAPSIRAARWWHSDCGRATATA
jgi:hypothetical protein